MIALSMSDLALFLMPQGNSYGKGGRLTAEHELLERALLGDGAAFRTLVEPHLAMLYRIAARACGDRALAEDAVQETLTIAFTKLDGYRADSSLRAFLATIAVKRARTLLRGERRRRGYEEQIWLSGHVPEPAELIEVERSAQVLRAALEAMPEKRRQVVLLRLDGGLSYAEIASAIGSTEGSARTLAHLAMNDLRSRLRTLLGPAAKQELTQ
jgi:RNA polymerase sigma-70 factor (ECF subfamily)